MKGPSFIFKNVINTTNSFDYFDGFDVFYHVFLCVRQ